jgi:5-(carboxyamino)imidazole ribonucleotide mutase
MKASLNKSPVVGIIMGSRSDLRIMKEAVTALKELKIAYDVQIVSAHRTPKRMFEYAENAYDRGIRVIIAGAGGAAHLPGMVASLTSIPVIGVPIQATSLKGLDALLSIAQMPGGVPVACVAVDNAYNAGLLAAKMLIDSPRAPKGLKRALDLQRDKLRKKVLKSARLV